MAPDLFDLNDDDDRAQAITGLVPASREQAAARASAACPEGAIARHR
jgi:ferredoxin